MTEPEISLLQQVAAALDGSQRATLVVKTADESPVYTTYVFGDDFAACDTDQDRQTMGRTDLALGRNDTTWPDLDLGE